MGDAGVQPGEAGPGLRRLAEPVRLRDSDRLVRRRRFRFTAFSARRSPASVGAGAAGSALCAWYCLIQPASAQFRAKRAVPAARAKQVRCTFVGSSAMRWAISMASDEILPRL
jgi:hypothetical protein